jgi:hypothetical protein
MSLNEVLAPMDAEIAKAEQDVLRLKGALRLVQERARAPGARDPNPADNIARARSRLADAEGITESLLAQRAADETIIIARALAPLNDALTTAVPKFVDTYHGALYQQLQDLAGL